MSNVKWNPVENPDVLKRKPKEWAEIYKIKLQGDVLSVLWSEYEWSYHLPTLSYFPAVSDFDKVSEMLMRADELRRDLFLGADLGENQVLKEGYMETNWVKSKLKMF